MVGNLNYVLQATNVRNVVVFRQPAFIAKVGAAIRQLGKPALVHCFKERLLGNRIAGRRTNDGVDAAPRAKRGFLLIAPIFYLGWRRGLDAIEAPTDCTLLQLLAVADRMLVCSVENVSGVVHLALILAVPNVRNVVVSEQSAFIAKVG